MAVCITSCIVLAFHGSIFHCLFFSQNVGVRLCMVANSSKQFIPLCVVSHYRGQIVGMVVKTLA